MDFGEQIKTVRTDNGLTQEQMALRLHVSRQAVSNWENNKNLPDIGLLIDISKTFNVSLDKLITGDEKMNNMTQKLIKDTSETRRAKFNAVCVCVGFALLLLGAALLGIKAASVEYVDAQGVLHENFFLLPAAFLLLFCGVLSFAVAAGGSLLAMLRDKQQRGGVGMQTVFAVCFGVLLMCLGVFFVLLAANSGANTAVLGTVLAALGILLAAWATVRYVCKRKKQ